MSLPIAQEQCALSLFVKPKRGAPMLAVPFLDFDPRFGIADSFASLALSPRQVSIVDAQSLQECHVMSAGARSNLVL
jgi:hypothetical protein